MKIYKIIFPYGIAVVVAESAAQAIELANKDKFICERITESNTFYVEDYYVTGGEPKVIAYYSE